MSMTKSTIEKLADVLIRLGAATDIGSVATFFVSDFLHVFSGMGMIIGISLIFSGLYVNNLSERI